MLPILFVSNGTADAVFGIANLGTAAERLEKAGCAVSAVRVAGHGHGIVPLQIDGAVAHLRSPVR